MIKTLVILIQLLALAACNFGDQAAEETGLISAPQVIDSTLLITAPANGTYQPGQKLQFKASVPSDVTITVSGSPKLNITIGSTGRVASYASGSGTSQITFEYTIQNGEQDNNGITLANVINLSGSSITLSSGAKSIAASNTFNSPNTSSVLVNTPAIPGNPVVALNTLNDITSLNYTNYVVSGTCSENGQAVDLNIGGTLLSPTCTTGNFTQAIDLSAKSDSLSFVITADHSDGLGNNATQDSTTVVKDTLGPQVSSVSITNGTYAATNTISIVVNFDENLSLTGSPKIDLTFDQYATASAQALKASNGASSINFDYTVAVGDEDLNGIDLAANINLNGATLTDAYGNDANLVLTTTNFAAVLIDSIAASVTLNAPAIINIANKASYTVSGTCNIEGNNVDISVGSINSSVACTSGLFNKSLDVTALVDSASVAVSVTHSNNSGSSIANASNTTIKDTVAPVLSITSATTIFTGNVTSYSISGTCTNDTSTSSQTINILIGTLPTTATCSAGTFSSSAINVSTVGDGASISITADMNDTASNPSNTATTTVVKDTIAPTISITAPTAASYINNVNDSATFAVTGSCNEALAIDALVDGVAAPGALGFSCDGAAFNASIDTTGLAEGSHTISLTISDAYGNAGNASVSVTKDTQGPQIIAANFTSVEGSKVSTDIITIELTFDENITINTTGGTPSIDVVINSGNGVANMTASTATTATFSYTVGNTDMDFDGLETLTTLALNGATIIDNFGSAASLTFSAASQPGTYIAPAGIVSWYDADSSYITLNSGNVSQWNDKSGNGRHMAQATASQMPLYDTNGNANGLNTVSFDGSDDYLDLTASDTVQTIFIVFKENTMSAGSIGQLWGSFSEGGHVALDDSNVVQGFSFNGNVANNKAKYSLDGSANTNFVADSAAYPWSASSWHLVTTELKSAQAFTTQCLGAEVCSATPSNLFKGEIAEIIIFDGKLNQKQADVKAYLNGKYNIYP